MSQADAILFEARFQTESLRRIQKICWNRCSEGLVAEPEGDKLPDSYRKCMDRCVDKFVDTAVAVSLESQALTAAAQRQQALAETAVKVGVGAAATAALVGLGCFLFRGDGDD